ncbi:MAG: peptide-methionine (S)-S-oxide reductase MsrA [Gammaproteobacteria bacterium]|nr:peptide-methionine (S)-S-oxide reductase MsrA [Gammaproteobacteria bacterium]MBQ0840625.1 peptide-methionine (S)-S-oxide reductase MsrA [Gammaproteobacteria bacterium]
MSDRLQQTLARIFVILALCCAITPPLHAEDKTQQAIFAGGCFWCMEPPFDALEGVISTTSGYIGGTVAEPTYKQVSSGTTGHTEALKIIYDPEKITYEKLLATFWENIDPVDLGGQFCDRGSQYRSEIFYSSDQQRDLAKKSKQQLDASDVLPAPVQTAVSAASAFYPAEDYHQNYYQKNPKRYKFYSWNCGRKQRLLLLWGKPYDQH